MSEPVSTISCVSNVFIRQMKFEKEGDVNQGHSHLFDHQTLLAKGSIKAVVDNKTSYFTAPQIIFIKAGIEHEFTATEDNTLCFCIHALRDGDGVEDIIDPCGVPEGINASNWFKFSKPLITKE
jgi:quercetin dioxygenase-like cupin family protein